MIWWVMVICGLMTFSMRFVMFSDIAPKQLPSWLEEALGFVPIAVLTAIIVPAVIIAPDGGLMLAGNARLPAALVAVTAALVTRSVLVTIDRLRNGVKSPFQHYHLLGTGMTLWVCWQITTVTGVVFGATIPDSWSLGFAIPLTFIALVAPAIRRRADLAACLTSGVLAIAGQPLPWKSWIILAGIGGILAGWLVHLHDRRRSAS